MFVLIDNYDSFTYIVRHYFEENNVEVKVFRNDAISENEVINLKPQGIIVSPGPKTPDHAGISVNLIKLAYKKIPVLGICLGHQSIAQAYGASIVRAKKVMHGKISKIHHDKSLLFKNMPQNFKATRYHSLVVEEKTLPSKILINARSNDNVVMSISYPDAKAFGVQFHPESIETNYGNVLIKNFISICEKK
ncbi:MAG: Anthranilate synthase component 2 [Alphaproteobacteria bacterium MarineAlpha9_Bin1]|nr:MAG: Anthranilate synthase component 2 [Alphaproteobacteria bacterium MarineAlpha9_Bin1]